MYAERAGLVEIHWLQYVSSLASPRKISRTKVSEFTCVCLSVSVCVCVCGCFVRVNVSSYLCVCMGVWLCVLRKQMLKPPQHMISMVRKHWEQLVAGCGWVVSQNESVGHWDGLTYPARPEYHSDWCQLSLSLHFVPSSPVMTVMNCYDCYELWWLL